MFTPPISFIHFVYLFVCLFRDRDTDAENQRPPIFWLIPQMLQSKLSVEELILQLRLPTWAMGSEIIEPSCAVSQRAQHLEAGVENRAGSQTRVQAIPRAVLADTPKCWLASTFLRFLHAIFLQWLY